MTDTHVIPLDPTDTFQFACHAEVACFNQCCRDLQQALTPFDVLRLRSHLRLSWKAFIRHYARVHTGPASGLPVVTLRFDTGPDRRCPFVTPAGCSVYESRPASCRLYPLARAVQRNPDGGKPTEYYALVKEPHCRGFEQGPRHTVAWWIAGQALAPYNAANDRMLELIALKNHAGRGPLPPRQQEWAVMALYDLDRLKEETAAGELKNMSAAQNPLPDTDDDDAWGRWGLAWFGRVLSAK